MNEEIRLATKAQAAAVRTYLDTLGVTISHTQALEVIARGEGMRSRHLLAQSGQPATSAAIPAKAVTVERNRCEDLATLAVSYARDADWARVDAVLGLIARPRGPESTSAHKCTRFAYSYADGSNCKRASSTIFRGQLTRDQLRFIVSKLDEGLYFVPAQVGLESLQLAFTDEGGEDHWWHKLELGDEADWVVDADDNIIRAGDVSLAIEPNASDFATDADCSNLFFRFARLTQWDDNIQRKAVTAHVYVRPTIGEDGIADDAGMALAGVWAAKSTFSGAPISLLTALAEELLSEGFIPEPGMEEEMRRTLTPNAYQFCILGRVDHERGDVEANFDVSTHTGDYLTETPVLVLSSDSSAENISKLRGLLDAQLKAIRLMPAAYDAQFE